MGYKITTNKANLKTGVYKTIEVERPGGQKFTISMDAETVAIIDNAPNNKEKTFRDAKLTPPMNWRWSVYKSQDKVHFSGSGFDNQGDRVTVYTKQMFTESTSRSIKTFQQFVTESYTINTSNIHEDILEWYGAEDPKVFDAVNKEAGLIANVVGKTLNAGHSKKLFRIIEDEVDEDPSQTLWNWFIDQIVPDKDISDFIASAERTLKPKLRHLKIDFFYDEQIIMLSVRK